MVKQISFLLITIVCAMFFTFALIKVMPGDPVTRLANEIVNTQGVTYQIAEERAIAMLNYDPNETVVHQFVAFVNGLLHGDLGVSMKFKVPVTEIVFRSLPWTMLVAGTATILAFLVGTKIGLWASYKRSPKINTCMDIIASVLGSIPDYVLGFFLIMLFSMKLGLFPPRGAYSSAVVVGFNLPFFLSVIHHAILPITALFLVNVASWIVNMRAVSSNVLNEDYIVYAQARGISAKRIRKKYVAKNSMLPMITSLAVAFSLLVGGSPLVETIFSYPGVGFYLNNAIGTRDYALMQGMFFVVIVTVVVVNFLVEIVYYLIDPRLRRKR